MTARRAGPPDLDRLVELARRYSVADGHDFDDARVRGAFGPLLTGDEHGVVWLVDGDAAGYAVATWGWSIEGGGQEALLDEIYVEPPGTGVGGALLELVLADCRARGMSRMFLETERVNAAARRLYERHGFAEEESIWMSRALDPP